MPTKVIRRGVTAILTGPPPAYTAPVDPPMDLPKRPRRRTPKYDPIIKTTGTDDGTVSRMLRIRYAVRFFYDLQQLRMQSKARGAKQAEHAQAVLSVADKLFMDGMSDKLEVLEADALCEIQGLLNGVPIYEQWLKVQKGCGPTMSGVILAEFHIERCNTQAQLWSWSGLAVREGKADRLVKGQKARYNPWLKAKMVKVLGESLVRAKGPWKTFYDNYKLRKQNQLVPVCMACQGTKMTKFGKCTNCAPLCSTCASTGKLASGEKCVSCPEPTGVNAPWGMSDKHRHMAAVRYMVKLFLGELWTNWRKLEGLPVRVPYAEEYLGRKHHTLEQTA